MNRLTKKINSGYVLVDDKGMGVCTGCEATDKLGKLEDLEEKIGCPLEVRCKIATFEEVFDENGDVMFIEMDANSWFECSNPKYIGCITLKYSDYKTKFWLKADKSE